MPLSRSYISARAVIGNSGRKISPSALINQTWTDPTTADADGFSVSHAGAAAAGTTNMTLGGALCLGGVGYSVFSRNVVITATHGSSVVAMSGVITGLDFCGKIQTEAWSVTAGSTTKTFTGKKGFKTITSITEVIASDASTNTIVAGDGVVFGLATSCVVASAVKEVAIGAVVTTGTLVVASTVSTDDPRGTYAPSAAPNGTNDYSVWFISNTPENDMGLP